MHVFRCSLILFLVLPVIAGSIGTGVSLDVQHNLTVVSYSQDGKTVTEEQELSPGWMKAHLRVYGDDHTVYSFGGPENESGYVYGNETAVSAIIQGTPLVDIADQVGGLEKKGSIRLVSKDGTFVSLPYAALYHTPPGIGTAVLAWNITPLPGMSPDNDSYRLFFISQDHILSTGEMTSLFPEEYWSYEKTPSGILPSAAALSSGEIVRVEVRDPVVNGWNLIMKGELAVVVNETEYDQGIPGLTTSTWSDPDNTMWSGYPLWMLISLIDDELSPSGNLTASEAFNNSLVTSGYTITISNADGTPVDLVSDRVARNDRIILANRVNGNLMMQKYPDFPLKLTGSDLAPAEQIGNVRKITLTRP